MADVVPDEPLLFANAFVQVHHTEQRRVIRVTRTSHPIQELTDVELAWGSVTRLLAGLDRHRNSLLLDMRRAKGRNDDAFERAVAKHRAATVNGFERAAVLVQSLHGKLQVQRHVREDGLGEVCIFDTEAEAIAWLLEAKAVKGRRLPGLVPRR
jgi:hypothetical protein